MVVGKKIPRIDGYDKATGRAKYTDDLCDKSALIVKIKHATIGNGRVVAMDISKALEIPGVVKIVTCFDVPDIKFPTAGHPWSLDPGHQDVADRYLLTDRIRFYGDDICAVIAEDEVTAAQAIRAITVEYEEYPVVLDALEAIKEDAPQIHEEYPGNILGRTSYSHGDYEAAIQEEGLIKVEGWYETPVVQHTHIENHICYAQMEAGKIVVTTSTQIPHIVRRVVGQALGLPWGKIRIIKPYIGGGFGNKQDVLYEPLCAYLTTQVGGRLVKLDNSREETFVCTRTRHGFTSHIISWARPDGTLVARKLENYSNQGAYASHGHSICAKATNMFPQLYPCPNIQGDGYTVFTNRPVAGAMRGYGIPQAMFAGEAHIDDLCKALGMDPLEWRNKFVMEKGFVDGFSKNENYYDTYRETMEKGRIAMEYDKKLAEYQNQTGPIRRGVGLALFWYNTSVWPISLESSSCRMVMNQDGTIQLMTGETEIGQGCDTVYAQMTADVLGIPVEHVHVVSTQDTDVTPFGTGAYASRQTFVGGFAIRQTGLLMKERILKYATTLTRQADYNLDIVDGHIVRKSDGRVYMDLEELATQAIYSTTNSQHITAESTFQVQNNAYSFGCSFAEVEVDVPLCQVKLLNLINVHDCGTLINPQLAEAQVHGGMSMGIGFGLSEQMIFDPKTGKTLNDNLLDYKLSTFMDHPNLQAIFVENPEPTHPYGVKSLGEPPACPVAPAIRNAVLQTTGVSVNKAPLNPHVLFEAFSKAGLL